MILKYLIPFDRFTIDSSLSAQEASRRLQAVMKPKTYFRLFSTDGGELEGVMTPRGFRVNRIPRGRNSFNAQVIGEIDPAPGGCRIRVHMRMLVVIYAFMAVWLCGVASFMGLSPQTLQNLITTGRGDITFAAVPTGMLCFGVALTNFGFWTSANRLKASLQTLFQAR